MIIKSDRYFILIAFLAFCVYQCVNFIYFPVATVFGDETRFIREAIKLSEVNEFWNFTDRAWEMPLTAIIYSFFYSIVGSETALIVVVRLFQSVLLIFQAYLLYGMSLKIFNDKASAFITFVAVLFYPFFIYYQGLLLSETIFNTFLIATFYFIYKWYESKFVLNKSFILANIFLVASIYVKGTLSILPPILLTLFFLINHFNFKESIKVFSYSAILYALLMSPWWIRNYIVLDHFVPFTTSSGKVLYLGNNPSNKYGGCDMAVDVEREKFASIAKIDDEIERNNAYKQEAVKFITENPSRFLELMILKLKRFYNVVPNAEKFSKGYYKWVTLFSYGTVFSLFLISIIAHIKYFKRLSAIYILFLYYTILHMVFIASLRYRLPLEPFMILLSSNVLSLIYRRIYASKN